MMIFKTRSAKLKVDSNNKKDVWTDACAFKIERYSIYVTGVCLCVCVIPRCSQTSFIVTNTDVKALCFNVVPNSEKEIIPSIVSGESHSTVSNWKNRYGTI